MTMSHEPEPTRRYLEEQLALDPGRHAALILARRDRWLAGESLEERPDATSGFSREDSREAVEARLNQLATELWERDAGAVRSELESLPLSEHPALARRARRLADALALRDELARADADPRLPRSLIDGLRAVCTASRPERARVTARVERQLVTEPLRRRFRRALRVLERDHSRLYALEAAWLESLIPAGKERARYSPARTRASIGCTGVIVLYFVLQAIARIVDRLLDG